jgi:DNA-binding transcriptional regulator YiaG
MANLAAALKSEVGRLARKEVRAETEALKKAVAAQRADLAGLRRKLAEFERTLKALTRAASAAKPPQEPGASAEGGGQFRFRAAGMAANRKRLGLSAADFGLLVGATGQSVYAWEAGKSKPSGKNLAAIAALRGVGKREVAKKLAELKQP